VNCRASRIVLLLALAAAPPAVLAQAAPPAPERDPGARVVGRIRAPGSEIPVSLDAFTAFVLVDEGTSPDGAVALDFLVQERVVAVEAQRRGLSVDEPTLDRRIRELDALIQKSKPEAGGILGLARQKHLTLPELREKIRTSMLAEQMMAADFGLKAGAAIPEEKQSLWYHDQKRAAVKRDGLPAGVVADVDGRPVRRTEWGTLLYRQLPEKEQEKLREDFKGATILLRRGAEAKIEATKELLEREIAARDAALVKMLAQQGMPNQGVGFLDAVKARGQDPVAFVQSDRFRAEVVLNELARRQHGRDGFKAYYEANRADFDKRFGRRIRLAAIFLAAAPKKSAKVTRTWAEATDELDRLKGRILADPSAVPQTFGSQAAIHSDDTASRARGGDLGLLGHDALDARGLSDSLLDEKAGQVVGPVNARDGVYLLLVGDPSPASPFEEIQEEVEKAARREVLLEATRDAVFELDL
jgi:PPIC-type PPIASE domain